MQPVILVRDEAFKEGFAEWKKSSRSSQLLAVFKQIYESSFFGTGDVRCDIIRQPQYNMLVLHYTDDFGNNDFAYLMDHIQERLINEGYYNYMSDRKQETHDGGLRQTVERHYLKPATIFNNNETERPDRKFGNVIVEVYYEGEESSYLKITCNYYSERLSIKEKGIDKLMEVILAGPNQL